MNDRKYKKELLKMCKNNNFELIREKKHFIFKHEITNRKVTCSKSPSSHFAQMKLTEKNIKYHNAQYLRVA